MNPFFPLPKVYTHRKRDREGGEREGERCLNAISSTVLSSFFRVDR